MISSASPRTTAWLCTFASSLVLASFAATGCSSGDKKEEQAKAAEQTPPEPASAEENAGAEGAGAEATGGEGEGAAGTDGDEAASDTGEAEVQAPVKLDVTVGVESCDTYATKWKQCIAEHAPEDLRTGLEKDLSEQLAAWKQTVDGGGSAAAVEIGCTTAHEGAKAQAKDWGCDL